MPVNLPPPSSDFVFNWLLTALMVLFAGLWLWAQFRRPRKMEIEQPITVTKAKEYATRGELDALRNSLRQEIAAIREEFDEWRKHDEASRTAFRAEITSAVKDLGKHIDASLKDECRRLYDKMDPALNAIAALENESANLREAVREMNRKISP